MDPSRPAARAASSQIVSRAAFGSLVWRVDAGYRGGKSGRGATGASICNLRLISASPCRETGDRPVVNAGKFRRFHFGGTIDGKSRIGHSHSQGLWRVTRGRPPPSSASRNTVEHDSTNRAQCAGVAMLRTPAWGWRLESPDTRSSACAAGRLSPCRNTAAVSATCSMRPPSDRDRRRCIPSQ